MLSAQTALQGYLLH